MTDGDPTSHLRLPKIWPEKGALLVPALHILELAGMWCVREAVHRGPCFKGFITRKTRKNISLGKEVIDIGYAPSVSHRHTDTHRHTGTCSYMEANRGNTHTDQQQNIPKPTVAKAIATKE